MNRGRIQAQGDSCEKSECWAQNEIPTKVDGLSMSAKLKNQLSQKELTIRATCFQKLERCINQAPNEGYSENIKQSFPLSPPKKGIRVDVEIIKGYAFKD